MKIGKKFRKVMAGLLVATALIPSLAGCGGGSADNKSKKNSKGETVTMLVLGDKPTNGRYKKALAELNDKMKEKGLDAKLELFYIPWTDWQTNYNTQLLSADGSIDLITTATDWLYAWENSKKGAFLELTDELLEENAPKTYTQVKNDGNWELCQLDGKTYFIPEDNYTQFTNHGFFYRGDWAKEAGFADGTITKFEDFTKYFQYILDNKKDVIPWDVNKNNAAVSPVPIDAYIQGHAEYWSPLGLSAGNYGLWNTTKSDPYTITSALMESDEYIEGAKLAKKWNDMGVWREDALSYEGDTRENFYAGTSGTDQHHAQTFYSSVAKQMEEKQPGSDPKFFYWGTENNNFMKDIKTHGAMAVSEQSKKPELALQVYDMIRNDEECYKILNYGIKGSDYELTEEGLLTYPEGFDVTKDALGTNFWGGRMDEYELDKVTDYEKKHEMIAELDAVAQTYPYETLLFDRDTIDSYQSAFAAILANYVPQLSTGKFADPEAEIKKMRKELKDAGYDEVKAELQKQMDAWAAKQ